METPQGDHLMIKHKMGDPIDWTRYSISIYNQSNPEQHTTMNDLEGEITAGEGIIFTASNAPEFGRIDYEEGQAYNLEIYNIENKERVWQKRNIVCY